jgi:hypothetical protein
MFSRVSNRFVYFTASVNALACFCRGQITLNTKKRKEHLWKPFQNVPKFKHLGRMEQLKSCIREQIKGRLTSKMLSTVQFKTLCSRLLLKNVNCKINVIIMHLLYCMGVQFVFHVKGRTQFKSV